MPTNAQAAGWVGRELYDPYGERLGPVAAVLTDEDGGEPAWLTISLRATQPAGRAVPAAEVQESGFALRTPQTAATVRAAPPVATSATLESDQLAALVRHYGALEPPAVATDPLPPSAPPVPSERAVGEIVQALLSAHAMEQAMLKQLAAMIWELSDQELVHDLTFHHKATNDHAQWLRERLGELGSHRSSRRDLAAKLPAWLTRKRTRLRHHTVVPDVRDALAAERAEVKAYLELERLARRAGDPRTAQLARRIRADEEAMIATLMAGLVRYGELDAQEDGNNPFAAPPELIEAAPRT